ncbi:MAG TPA: hypothetical protein VFS76_24840 [Pyrinomonadaceae bacterium]|nr:hypothetical protein [Pyrinomonadaceae bacterium]
MQNTRILSAAILISLIICWPESLCKAQKKIPAADYDYYALAITSITEITGEASKLPDIPQRAKVLIEAAKVLQPAKRDESIRLLELVLRDLREWGSADDASWRQRNMAASLRNEALAVYVSVDPEKALVRQKELKSLEEPSVGKSTPALNLKSGSWRAYFNDRQTAADQLVKVALPLIESEPDRALTLVVQSVQGGTVSGALFEIVDKLIKNGNRALLDRLETNISQALATTVTLDPYSLSSAGVLGLDKDMPQAAKNGFASFFMRSLQAWTMVVKEPGIDMYYIIGGFNAFSDPIRHLISQSAPDQLLEFDLLLDQVAAFVPENKRDLIKRVQPETLSDPKERLNDILRDQDPRRRDLRLNRLVSELLRNESEDFAKRLELAGDAINGFIDPDAKSAYTDLLTITRVNALVKQKKIIEAQQLAGLLSSEETRAWALLAVTTEAAKEDKVLGFESISKALKALDAASPSPYKTELALLAAAMLVKDDSRRAFETLVIAAKYANSSKDTSRTKPPFAFGLEAKIGEIETRLGVVPLNLSEVRIDPTLSGLATTDWFRADQLVREIHEPSLRLRLRLQFAGAVLAKELRLRKASPKPSTTN